MEALGIGAASFWSEAEKDIAESPTAIAGTPKRNKKKCSLKKNYTFYFRTILLDIIPRQMYIQIRCARNLLHYV